MKRLLYILLLVVAAVTAVSCSTKKNTASTRRWQSFVTRYNVYFNADQAYIEGRQAQDKGLKEDYTNRLPLFGVGYEKQRSLGKSNFETAITKCEKAIQLHSIKKKPVVDGSKSKTPKMKAYLARKEFNPFLKNAWLLMGKSQFQQGEFDQAAATFSYITRYYAAEPAVVAEARIWLARCYAELDWIYDAEDVIQRMERDTMPSNLKAERALTMADYYIRQDKLEEAVPFLKLVVKKEKSKARKAREYYLLAQIYMALDRKQEAYKALSKCIKQSPPYEMSFHARILQTEALTTAGNARSMIKRLKRMAKSDNNADYLDQVYYAIGNIYMQQNDTLQAIASYETGREKAKQKGPETAMLLLRLGGIYWEQRRFDKAQPCYTEAIGLLDKTHDQYKELTRRSKVLDALVPPTSAIHLQDSLQWLASVDEATRNEAIDRVIKELKKKEEEERKARRDSAAEARQKDNPNAGGPDAGRGGNTPMPGANMGGSQEWYFYNQQLVMQGKQAFQKDWGNRKNEDDWRRSNRTVIASPANETIDYEKEDSIQAVQEALRDSLLATGMSEKEAKRWIRDHQSGDGGNGEAGEGDEDGKKELTPEEDPHQREYYLAQIPFTPEQKAASDSIIRESLYEAAVIEKDKLEDLPLAAETFGRLERQFPDFSKMDEATYHLFLLYSHWAELDSNSGRTAEAQQHKQQAEVYRNRMRTDFPDYAMTPVICDPDFEYNARFGRELEDSLYTLTYDAYRRGDTLLVAKNFETSTLKFPKGANRPKFIFLHALSRLGTAPTDSVSAELRKLAQDFPKSDVAEMAGMIVKGIEAGRTIGSGGFDLGGLWSRRTAQAGNGNEGNAEDNSLKPDRDVPFVFLVAYETDADLYGLNDGKKSPANKTDDRLLYDLARFNFTTYVFRGFEISKEREKDITQFRVSGFRNFDDVHNYTQHIFRDDKLGPVLRNARIELISEDNLRKLGTVYSFEDYRHFYDSCFAPLKLNPDLPLSFGPEDDDVEYDEGTPEPGIIYSPDGKPLRQDKITPVTPTTPIGQPDNGTVDENGDPIFDEDPLRVRDDGDAYVDDDDAPAKRTTSTDDDVYADDDAPAKKNTSADDDVYADDDAPAKKNTSTDDDVYVDDDAAPAKKNTSADDDVYVDDDAAPAKKNTSADDDFYVEDDEEFGRKPKKQDDDEEVYEE